MNSKWELFKYYDYKKWQEPYLIDEHRFCVPDAVLGHRMALAQALEPFVYNKEIYNIRSLELTELSVVSWGNIVSSVNDVNEEIAKLIGFRLFDNFFIARQHYYYGLRNARECLLKLDLIYHAAFNQEQGIGHFRVQFLDFDAYLVIFDVPQPYMQTVGLMEAIRLHYAQEIKRIDYYKEGLRLQGIKKPCCIVQF